MIKKIKKSFISWISVFGMRILLAVLSFMPEKVIYFLGKRLSLVYYCLARKNRRLAWDNLELAFANDYSKDQQREIAKQSFLTMGNIVLDTIRYKDFDKKRLLEYIEIEGMTNLNDSLKKGRGVIAASAHLGSFTIMGGRLTLEGYKSTYIARHARNKKIEQLIMSFCRQAGQKIIFSRPVFNCMRLCKSVLSRNEVLIIEMDQNFGTEGMEVNFFGQQAMVNSGPVKLSRATGAAIVPMFIVRKENNRHVIKIEPEVKLVNSGNEAADVRENLQKIISVVEKNIRQYPGQWVNWIHKRWEVPAK